MKKIWSKLRGQEGEALEYTDDLELNSTHPKLETSLEENLKNIQDALGHSVDLIIRVFKLGSVPDQSAAVLFIDGLVDKEHVGNFIIEKMMNDDSPSKNNDLSSASTVATRMKEQIISVAEVEETEEWKKTIQALVSGKTILFLDGWDQVMICPLKGGASRAISEPSSEQTIRGPQESFGRHLFIQCCHWNG